MNCYSGLAKRIIKSCFPRIIPVTQLEPLDAKNIIKQDITNISTNKPILDEEAREAAFTCRRCVKTKEKEKTLLLKMLLSQTDTDESYDSDDSEFGVPTYPVIKSSLFGNKDEDEDTDKVEQLVRSIVAHWVTISKKWQAATTIQAAERGRAVRSSGADFIITTHYAYNEQWRRESWWVTTYTVTRTAQAMATLWNVEKRAATIIQAAERGRVVRVWKAQFTDELAREMSHIYRTRYLKRDKTNSHLQIAVEREQCYSIAFNSALFAPVRNTILGVSGPIPLRSAVWSASPKCAMAWIKLAEQRRYGHYFYHV